MMINLSPQALSRLAGLCDARVHSLKKMIAENDGNAMSEDDVSEAEMDITYFERLADDLRKARNS